MDALNALKWAIVDAVAAHADAWGVRVKRRLLTDDAFVALLDTYTTRAVIDTTFTRGK